MGFVELIEAVLTPTRSPRTSNLRTTRSAEPCDNAQSARDHNVAERRADPLDVPDDSDDDDEAEYMTLAEFVPEVDIAEKVSEKLNKNLSARPLYELHCGTSALSKRSHSDAQSAMRKHSFTRDPIFMCAHMRNNSGTSTTTSASASSVETSASTHAPWSRVRSAPRSRSAFQMDSALQSGCDSGKKAHRSNSDASVLFDSSHGRRLHSSLRSRSKIRANITLPSAARAAVFFEEDGSTEKQPDSPVCKNAIKRKIRSRFRPKHLPNIGSPALSPDIPSSNSAAHLEIDIPAASYINFDEFCALPVTEKHCHGPRHRLHDGVSRRISRARFRKDALKDCEAPIPCSTEMSKDGRFAEQVAGFSQEQQGPRPAGFVDSENAVGCCDPSTQSQKISRHDMSVRPVSKSNSESSPALSKPKSWTNHSTYERLPISSLELTGPAVDGDSSKGNIVLSPVSRTEKRSRAQAKLDSTSLSVQQNAVPVANGSVDVSGSGLLNIVSVPSSNFKPTADSKNVMLSGREHSSFYSAHPTESLTADLNGHAEQPDSIDDVPGTAALCGHAASSSCDDKNSSEFCVRRCSRQADFRDRSSRVENRDCDAAAGPQPKEFSMHLDDLSIVSSASLINACTRNAKLFDESEDFVASSSSADDEPSAIRFAPSSLVPEFASSTQNKDNLSQVTEAIAFPTSHSPREAKSESLVSPRCPRNRKLQKFRPPPIVTPEGGGPGFSGSSDFLDGAKRIPIVSSPTNYSTQITTYTHSHCPNDAVTISFAGGVSGSLCVPEKEERHEIHIGYCRVTDDSSVAGLESKVTVYAVSCNDGHPLSTKEEGRAISTDEISCSTTAISARNPCSPESSVLPSTDAITSRQDLLCMSPVSKVGDSTKTERSALNLSQAVEGCSRTGVSSDVASLSRAEAGECSDAARARNGILPADPEHPRADFLSKLAASEHEEQEEHFVFGSDGQFSDGGFVITATGLKQTPEKVRVYEKSDGDGSRSTNFILVRSLQEFERGPMLGSGASGHIYLACHSNTKAKMAVKVINVYDEAKRQQLLKELGTLIRQNTRYLLRCYGVFYDGAGFVHVLLEYMDRGSLADVIRKVGPVPEPVIRHIARHCLNGLAFLHKNRVLHRDVKTANILLSRRSGKAKLSDFGLARDLIPGTSIADTFVGTLAYMSPERLHGSEYTYASDVWGLGISLVECVLGRYPFEKPQSYFDYVAAVRSNPWELVQNRVSDSMLDFLQQCTQLEPSNRATPEILRKHPWMKLPLSGEAVSDRHADQTKFTNWLDSIPEIGEQASGAEGHSGGVPGKNVDASAQLNRERLRAKLAQFDGTS